MLLVLLPADAGTSDVVCWTVNFVHALGVREARTTVRSKVDAYGGTSRASRRTAVLGTRSVPDSTPMAKNITLFMWGYQPHFRIGLESFAERVLADAGLNVNVEALLVGVQQPGGSGHPVCVEPENGAWELDLFENLEARIEELVAKDPRQNMRYGDESSNRDKFAWMRATSVRTAVQERLEESDRKRGVRSFLGAATLVDEYLVVPIVQVASRAIAVVPALRRASREKFSVCTSYLDALVGEILSQASHELTSPEPGRSLTFERDSRDVLRSGGKAFMSTPEFAANRMAVGGMFDGCNQVSALRYEGSAGAGRMIVSRTGHPAVHVSLAFTQPVPIRSAMWARKVLQMGSADVALLCDGRYIYGLGRLCDAYDVDEEDAFIVDFVGHYTWELRHAARVLMRVSYDVPRLPSVRV